MEKPNKTADIIKPFGEYKTPGPNGRVIEELTKILEQAQRGEIVSFAIAIIRESGWVGSRFVVGSRGMSEIVGAVTILQHDLVEDWKFRDNDAI